jgi:hypothetical protein
MAAKYWYVAGNGSALWSTAANWYNGPGGTGGTTTVPTIADDVYLNAASGSGTITISAAASFQTLDCTGFTGTLAGTSTIAFNNAVTLGSSMTLTYTGTATTTGTTTFTTNGKTVTFNITVSTTNGGLILNDNFTMSSTATLTLSGGVVLTSTFNIVTSIGLFVSTGSVERYFYIPQGVFITGIGTVWNVTGTNFSYSAGSTANINNTTSSAKTITHTATTASATYGDTYRASIYISGAGTGSYTASGNFYDFSCYNTGGASINFGTTNIFENLDWGVYAPAGITPNMNWNNGTSTMTFSSDPGGIYLNSGMTITASPPISIANPTATQPVSFSNQYNKVLTSTITITGSDSIGIAVYAGNLITTGTITLTNGTISSSFDVYCSTLSTNNSNNRAIYITNLYLTGTGTLLSAATTTGLSVSISNIYVTGSASVARTLTLNAVFYPVGGVYLAGSGGSTIGLTPGAGIADVYVTNTGAATISIATSTIRSLSFSSGTNAIWSNSASQTLTIQGDLYIASSAGNPTLTPNMIFNGAAAPGGNVAYISLNGKSLVTGTVVLNDTASAVGVNQMTYNFATAFSSNAAVTITSAQTINSFGYFNATSLTATAANDINFNSTLTLTGGITYQTV